jgi:hypothetical protein
MIELVNNQFVIQISNQGIQGVGVPSGGTTNQVLAKKSDTNFDTEWQTNAATGVQSVSVTSANGFAGTVASPTSNAAISISTTITGVLKGNGTAISSSTTTDLPEGTNLYFTDERAQDAVGAMVDSTIVYVDSTPLLTRAALTGVIAAPQASNTTSFAAGTVSDLNSLTPTVNTFAAFSATNLIKQTASQAKTSLAITNTDVSGLGTLATQNGTFSGTSSGTNTGDITFSGENYLSLTGQALTANAVNLAGSNVTGVLPIANVNVSTLVPYTGATTDLTMGSHNITAATATLSGGALKQNPVITNTGSAYTIDPANGAIFTLTMTSATPALTIAAGASSYGQLIQVNLIQDSSGNRAPTFSGASYYTGVAPTVNQGVGAVTTLSLIWTNGAWILYEQSPLIGKASQGYTGISNLDTSTITLGGAFTMSGAYTFGGTLTANTAVTFPTTGTLLSTTTNAVVGDNTTITGTTYTPVVADAGKEFYCSNAASQTITFDTYANQAFLPNAELIYTWAGVGQTIFAAAGGVTLKTPNSMLKIAVLNGSVFWKKDPTAINTWWGCGNMSA